MFTVTPQFNFRKMCTNCSLHLIFVFSSRTPLFCQLTENGRYEAQVELFVFILDIRGRRFNLRRTLQSNRYILIHLETTWLGATIQRLPRPFNGVKLLLTERKTGR